MDLRNQSGRASFRTQIQQWVDGNEMDFLRKNFIWAEKQVVLARKNMLRYEGSTF